MASTTVVDEASSISQPPPPKRYRQTHQACDNCRERKVKCEPGPLMTRSPSDSGSTIDQDTRQSVVDDHLTSACRRCTSLRLPCTFLLPVKPRGPVKGALKRSRQYITRSRATSPNACPPVTDLAQSHAIISPQLSTTTRHYQSLREDDGLSDNNFFHTSRDDHTSSPTSTQLGNYSIPLSPALASPVASLSSCRYPINRLCDRSLYIIMLGDYLELLYPSIPVVHRPSFIRDVSRGLELADDDFLGLTLAICAVLVATMPRKFQEYKSNHPSLQFNTRTEMVHYCRELIASLQKPDHYDVISLNKWAVPYLLSIAYFQLGQHNRARILEVEAIQLARLLDLYNPGSHIGLSRIETQLRKRAFWLMFYTFVHTKLMRKERLSFVDDSALKATTLHQLLLIEVDDEMLEDYTPSQPPTQVSLAAAFNYHSLTFWTAIMPVSHPDDVQGDSLPRSMLPDVSTPRITYLKERLHALKYVLDGAPKELLPWRDTTKHQPHSLSDSELPGTKLRNSQLESLRADLHITHLWLQSIILEELENQRKILCTVSSGSESPDAESSRWLWTEREIICRDMLHVLHGISTTQLEPNGNHLTHKIRDVAVTLLGPPFAANDPMSKRSNKYLQEFVDILSRLDSSGSMSTVNMQTWVVVESSNLPLNATVGDCDAAT